MKGIVWAVVAMLVANVCLAEDVKVKSQPLKIDAKTTEAIWLTDFEAAKKQAATEGKHMLLDFSGSDWCGWCIRLDKEVFSKAEFEEYAKENLVLVMLDFPRKKQQPDALKKQNEALAAKYRVEGFPTVLILDSKGNSVAKTGYQAGGADVYVKHLKELIANSKK